ncbi:unnamed protein product [Amoebophrya sp. A25]|nr:unnamed protein product [Amoebophrya sp. A25]|eukprot:GSA25T00014231001.1
MGGLMLAAIRKYGGDLTDFMQIRPGLGVTPYKSVLRQKHNGFSAEDEHRRRWPIQDNTANTNVADRYANWFLSSQSQHDGIACDAFATSLLVAAGITMEKGDASIGRTRREAPKVRTTGYSADSVDADWCAGGSLSHEQQSKQKFRQEILPLLPILSSRDVHGQQEVVLQISMTWDAEDADAPTRSECISHTFVLAVLAGMERSEDRAARIFQAGSVQRSGPQGISPIFVAPTITDLSAVELQNLIQALLFDWHSNQNEDLLKKTKTIMEGKLGVPADVLAREVKDPSLMQWFAFTVVSPRRMLSKRWIIMRSFTRMTCLFLETSCALVIPSKSWVSQKGGS